MSHNAYIPTGRGGGGGGGIYPKQLPLIFDVCTCQHTHHWFDVCKKQHPPLGTTDLVTMTW